MSEHVWEALDAAVVQAARPRRSPRAASRPSTAPAAGGHVATRLGTKHALPASAEGEAVVCVPDVVLLYEVRVDFSRAVVLDRGVRAGRAPVLSSTGSAEAAARELALAEDRVAFHGHRRQRLSHRPGNPRAPTRRTGSAPARVLADLVKAVEDPWTPGAFPGPYEAVLPPARY